MDNVVFLNKPKYQCFRVHLHGEFRILWLNGKPLDVEIYLPKEWKWVRMQRYKAKDIIAKYADASQIGMPVQDLEIR